METLKGIVTDLQNVFHTADSANHEGSSRTRCWTQFHIGARAVNYRGGSKPLAVQNGDIVLVAGKPGNNALEAIAVRNATSGIVSGPGGVGGYIFAAVFILIFGFVASFVAAVYLGSVYFAVFVIFLAGIVFVLRRAMAVQKAVRWVKLTLP